MKEEGKASRAPLTESFLRYPNNKFVILALLGATAGMSVVWYTGQFYTLFSLTITLKLGYLPAYWLVLISLLIGTPFFIVFGGLSDRIGRLKIILAGCVIAALTYMPLFSRLTHYVNPELESFAERTPVALMADASTCELHIFVGPWSRFSDCKDFVTKLGLAFKTVDVSGAGDSVILSVGATKVDSMPAIRTCRPTTMARSFPRRPIRQTSTGSWPN
jgi:hypothetical protein